MHYWENQLGVNKAFTIDNRIVSQDQHWKKAKIFQVDFRMKVFHLLHSFVRRTPQL